ncbi:hypothetical protein GCM10011579_081430 [Streptomyces albiflavescens]|uniref:DNA-binding domain-containing protein n=1 Tax=Streptomyces albiflavescens TaxID=1623582 RepID=A0A918D9I7_9ACTN|nr:hypothetical protein GCM10011579_081430 [Streptomyces albiflavescens]
MSHRNARLTVHGRRLLVERVIGGRPVAHVAAEMGISRATAHKWIRRRRSEGEPGLDEGRIRSQLPHRAAHGPRPAARPGEARTPKAPSHLFASPGTVSIMFPLRGAQELRARPPRQFPH